MSTPAPDLDTLKTETRAWVEGLRDRIHAALEALEDAADPALYPGEPGRFVRTEWQRPEGGGGVTRIGDDGLFMAGAPFLTTNWKSVFR